MIAAQSRRGAPPGFPQRNTIRRWHRNGLLFCTMVVISVVGPSYFLMTRAGSITTRQTSAFDESSHAFRMEGTRRRATLEQIGEVLSTEDAVLGNQISNLDIKDDELSEGRYVEGSGLKAYEEKFVGVESGQGDQRTRNFVSTRTESTPVRSGEPHIVEDILEEEVQMDSKTEGAEEEPSDEGIQQVTQVKAYDPTKVARKERREHRFAERATALLQHDDAESKKLEDEAIQRAKQVEGGKVGSYSVWRPDGPSANSDDNVRLMRDQLIMARAYTNIAMNNNNVDLIRDLKYRIRENLKALDDVDVDLDLPNGAEEKMKAMGQLLVRAKETITDEKAVVKKLRAMLQSSEEQLRMYIKQSNYLNQLAAKTVPKGLHCLSMRLTVDYNTLLRSKRNLPKTSNLEDTSLYHYALFSDNILAASVVVNSTVTNAKEPEKHVFHIVTDTLNYGAMRMWFLDNPPGKATIEVQNVDKFKWLNSSYCPVLRQLETESMKAYYFKSAKEKNADSLKYRNPKYLSMLNHLRFYLPEVFPQLDKILFLDDDIVTQKDLTPLWSVDLEGKVNGAVETCGKTFHRFDKYLNFSNPHIARHFDPQACGWAYGMNIFDLKEWKNQDITGIYHRWQSLNADRTLWKLGTLPPGLTTFYNLTHALDKSWHVLGLGYNPKTTKAEIEGAAVIHYNGNQKPWLEIGISKFKSYWTKYVKYDHSWLQSCNINH